MTQPVFRFVAAVVLFLMPLAANAFETRARAAWVYDVTTSTVLLYKDADRPLPPASMSKLMTLYMLFEALRDGRVTMETEFAVSARAAAMGGSTMFLDPRDRPTVRDLVLGIIVNSGNDACVVVAEGLAGSEEAFASQMTARANQIGLTETGLVNSSGWPAPGHVMSTRDIGILTLRLIEDFPDLYPYFNVREFDYKNRAPANRFNRNPLLSLNIGADGLKTGFTREAGYGLAGSATSGTRRVIFVITGLDSEVARAQESEGIVTWAFRQFALNRIARGGERIASADVWMGDAGTVGLVTARDVETLVPAFLSEPVHAEAVWHGPIEAPIAAGQPLGELRLSVPGLPVQIVPLLAETAIGPAGPGGRIGHAARALVQQGLARLAF